MVPKNTELLYGVVYLKPTKVPFRSFLATRLAHLVEARLPDGHLVRWGQPITCMDSEPEPDHAIVRGSEKDFWDDHPHTAKLVIEVCVTTHEYDHSKLPAYAAAGVKEVWLVLGSEKQTEVHRRPKGGKHAEQRLLGPGGRLVSDALPAFAVDLDALFSK